MTEEPSRRERSSSPQGEDRRGAPGRGRPSLPGWRVTPSGDGRAGGQPPGRPTPPRSGRWMVVVLVLGLLALNLWISYEAQRPASRVQIPYSPTSYTR